MNRLLKKDVFIGGHFRMCETPKQLNDVIDETAKALRNAKFLSDEYKHLNLQLATLKNLKEDYESEFKLIQKDLGLSLLKKEHTAILVELTILQLVYKNYPKVERESEIGEKTLGAIKTLKSLLFIDNQTIIQSN